MWRHFNDDWGAEGAIGYVDKTLRHRTPDNPDGEPYPPATRDALRDAFIAPACACSTTSCTRGSGSEGGRTLRCWPVFGLL